MKRKYLKRLFLTIVMILILFIPINASTININKDKYDKITVDDENLPELVLITGKDKLKEFCNSNNVENLPKYLNTHEITGKNPINIITTYGTGVPCDYIFELYGHFELSESNEVNFKVLQWRNIGSSNILLWDTIYFRYYLIIAIVLILICYVEK